MSEDRDEQTFTAIESTFATTLPRLEPLWIRDGVSMVGERMEIDTSADPVPRQDPSVVGRWTVTALPYDARIELLQPTRYQLRAPWHPDEGEQYAAGFWLPYCASDEEARQHVKDFYATRTPALVLRAREGWAKGDAPCDSALFETLDDAGYSATSQARVRKMPRDLRRVARRRNTARRSVFEMASDEGGVTWAVCEYAIDPSGLRYVPCDVCRWRDPQHRDELTRRAREYADCAQRLVDR